jgi:putative tricarboxylic transport membrane protein
VSVTATERSERGIPRWVAELAVAAVLLVLGVVVMVSNGRVGAGWAEDGPQSGYFPFRMGALLSASSLGIGFQALRKQRAELFVSWTRLRPVLQVLGPMVGYVALIQFLGMYVASAVFMAGFMKVIGRYPLWKSVLAGVISSAVLFWVFEIKFSVPMPKGPLESLFGY